MDDGTVPRTCLSPSALHYAPSALRAPRSFTRPPPFALRPPPSTARAYGRVIAHGTAYLSRATVAAPQAELVRVAESCAHGRVVSVLEGGYQVAVRD